MAFSFLYIRYEIECANEKTVDLNIFDAYAILVSVWICKAILCGTHTGFPANGAILQWRLFKQCNHSLCQFEVDIEPILCQYNFLQFFYNFCPEPDGTGGHTMESKKLEKPRENGTFSTVQGVMKPDEEGRRVFPTMKPLDWQPVVAQGNEQFLRFFGSGFTPILPPLDELMCRINPRYLPHFV